MGQKTVVLVSALALVITWSVMLAQGRHKLDKSEIERRFTDVTFDCLDMPKNRKFVAYDAPNGRLQILEPDGNISQDRTWYINDMDQRCATSPDWTAPKCFDLYEIRDGVYHQYLDGRHVYTLVNFRDGNQLSNGEALN